MVGGRCGRREGEWEKERSRKKEGSGWKREFEVGKRDGGEEGREKEMEGGGSCKKGRRGKSSHSVYYFSVDASVNLGSIATFNL
jgi:hypothetical protein